jgi:twitching motility protein PilJ
MTVTSKSSPAEKFSPEILELQAEVEKSPDDLVAKVSLASALEQSGYLLEAIEVYQEIKEKDTEGIFAASANKAIESLQEKLAINRVDNEDTREAKPSFIVEKTRLINPLQKFYNLPIGTKQFIALISSSLLSITGVLTVGMVIAVVTGRAQLRSQAAAELAVTINNYTAKSNEVETGFRGQADNPIIIQAAQESQQGREISQAQINGVRRVLINERKARQIEYATLVGRDGRIIANANKDRRGEIFNPNNLVTEILQNPRRLQTNAIVDWQEIQKESPRLVGGINNQNVLVNFSFTPVKNAQNQVLGLLIAGEIVNGKTIAMKKTVEAVDGGYNAVYMLDKNGSIELATSLLDKSIKDEKNREEEDFQEGVQIPDIALLKTAAKGAGGNLIERMKIQDQWFTVAVKSLANYKGEYIAFLVRGTPETGLDTLLRNTLALQMGVGLLTLLIAGIFAYIFGKALTKPIKKLQESARERTIGERHVRAEIFSEDEVGQLARTFNEMADRIDDYTDAIETQSQEREKEAQFQRKAKENLQTSVIRLLLDIEEASRGDLTVQAQVDQGEVGAIADAFNATIRSLRLLVTQVLDSAKEVQESAIANGQSVAHLSDNANLQKSAIESASRSVEEIAQSIQSVSKSTQDAAAIAKQSRLSANYGQKTMDQTVGSIYKVRSTVADTSKKAKRLAESSQEISKIVSIISGISEKTNLLAFNASIEAARAGENGQGFRIVADEVRRLAEQVTLSAQEIEQLITAIQQETAEMTKMMEESTTQVVTGTKLVQQTKETLQKLAHISEQIDSLLSSISSSTLAQKLASQKLSETMQEVEVVARETSAESESVATSLKHLVEVAMNLQQSASSFKVENS